MVEGDEYTRGREAARTVFGIVFPDGVTLQEMENPPAIVVSAISTAEAAGGEHSRGFYDELVARIVPSSGVIFEA